MSQGAWFLRRNGQSRQPLGWERETGGGGGGAKGAGVGDGGGDRGGG